MNFNSRKDAFFSTLIFGVIGFLLALVTTKFAYGDNTEPMLWPLLMIALVIGLLLWLYFGTNYQLTSTELKYKSGPFSGKINIDEIVEIEVGKTMWVGFRPATAKAGLTIKYQRFNELYISPSSNKEFVEEILKINDKIKIIE
jgi:hypothetical protein